MSKNSLTRTSNAGSNPCPFCGPESKDFITWIRSFDGAHITTIEGHPVVLEVKRCKYCGRELAMSKED